MSLWFPCCPCHPHVIPIIPMLSPHHPCCPHMVPTSPWQWSPCCLYGLHSMLSPHGPCCPYGPCHPHVIPKLSPCHPHCSHMVPMWSSLHHQGPHIISNPLDTHLPSHWCGGPQISKNSIRFEIIKIFQFCLKIWNLRDSFTYGWVHGLVCGWVDGWVDGWVQVKSLKFK